jgi:hypothetical protein
MERPPLQMTQIFFSKLVSLSHRRHLFRNHRPHEDNLNIN